MVSCLIVGCRSHSARDKRVFCRIPAVRKHEGEIEEARSRLRRRLWLKAISRKGLSERTLTNQRICGKHFVSGYPAKSWDDKNIDWVPTLNLGHNEFAAELQENYSSSGDSRISDCKRSTSETVTKENYGNESEVGSIEQQPDIEIKTEVTDATVVCSSHFEEDCFYRKPYYQDRRHLLPTAVPTKFEWTAASQTLVPVADSLTAHPVDTDLETANSKPEAESTRSARMPMCFDPECSHCSLRDTCRLFKFPTDPIERLKWLIVVKRRLDRRPDYKNDRVCSCHFVDGKKENGPTIFGSNQNKLLGFPESGRQKQNRQSHTDSPKKLTVKLNKNVRPISNSDRFRKKKTNPDWNVSPADFTNEREGAISPVSSSASTDTGWENDSDCELTEVKKTKETNKMTVLTKRFTDVAFETLTKFQENGFLCDAVLVAKCGGEVKAHAVLLAATSPIFLAALQIAAAGPHRFCFPEVELDVLQIAVHYAYTGKLNLPTVYSQMDKLSLLLSKLADLGFDLQKLHGCEMTFVRKVKPTVASKPAESFVSDLEHNYHKTNSKEPIRKKLSEVGDVNSNEINQHASKGNGVSLINPHLTSRPGNLPNSNGVPSSGPLKRTAVSILKPLHSILSGASNISAKQLNRSSDLVEAPSGLLSTGLDQNMGQVLVLDSDNPGFWDVVEETGQPQYFNLVDTSVEPSSELPGVALVNKAENVVYVCDFCDGPIKKQFKDEFGLSWHKIKMHWDKCLECSVCKRRFGSESILRTHLKRHLNMPSTSKPRTKNHKCDECGLSCETIARLNRHKMKHTGEKPFQCPECGKRFTMVSNLERHQLLHTGYRPFLCDFCGKGFMQRWTLTEHVNLHHEDCREIECALCDAKMKNRDEMEKHALEVHQLGQLLDLNEMIKKPESHLCDLCGKNFITTSSLRHHMRGHGNKPARCETCGKKFSTPYGLQLHMKLHTGERPFVCEVCQKGFIQKTSLMTHMVLHSGIRPFICIVCSKGFTSKGQLKQHMLMHTGEKPYKCGICSKQFTYKSSLTIHNRTHTGDKPFSCTVCGCTYTQMHHLRGHMRTHTGEKPFTCEICRKSYKNKIDLRYHYTRFHKVDVKKVTMNARSEYTFELDQKVAVSSDVADENSANNLEEFEICELKPDMFK